MPSARLVLPLAVAAAVLAPAAAHATDYCVQPAAACTPAHTYPQSGAGVQAALDAAVVSGDRVLLGAATYTSPTSAGFAYAHPTVQVEIVGAGSDQTVLTAPDDATMAVFVNPAAGSLIRDLGVRIGKRVNNASFLIGLRLSKGTARRVALTSDPALNGSNALILGAATFEDGSVVLPAGNSVLAVNPEAAGATVRGSTIVAGSGVNPHYDGFTLDRSRVVALTSGAFTTTALSGRITDSVLVSAGAGGSGITATTQNGTDAAVRVDHSTIVGSASSPAAALYANGSSNNHTATVDVHDSIVRGFQHARLRATNGALTSASVSTHYSAVTDTLGDLSAGVAGAGSLTSDNDIAADPLFVDAAGGDFRLSAASPAVDAGNPAGLLAGEPAVDLAGAPRLADGNAACGAVSDMGAYELARTAPTALAAAAAGGTAPAGQPIGFDAAGSSSPYAGAITYAWAFDDGAAASGPTAAHAFAAAGAHTATLTVTDACGLAGAAVTVGVTASAVPGGGPSGPGPEAKPGDTVRPVLSAFSLTNRRFAVGRVGTRTARKTVRGTTLRLTASEAVTLTVTVQRQVAGHRAGTACRSGAPRRGSGVGRCTVLKRVGVLPALRATGSVRLAFTGRVVGKALQPGAYVASAAAQDAAGNLTRRPVTAAFTIVRR
jgi:hypothetical protein